MWENTPNPIFWENTPSPTPKIGKHWKNSKNRHNKEGPKTMLEMNAAKFRAFPIPEDLESVKFWKIKLLAQIWTKNRIFQNLTDSRSSGMENAQNFAAIISSMVLGPSFFWSFFHIFPIFHFSLCPFFQFFHVFQFLGLGRGMFCPNMGLEGVFQYLGMG